MSARSDVIRGWLLRRPRPACVRVTDSEGESHDVDIPSGRVRWRDVAEQLEGLDPVRLEALSSDDKTLRIEKFGESKGAPEPVPVAAPAPERYASQVVPAALSGDPETVRLTHFANLLADAHREGYAGMRGAIDALTGIVRSQDARYEGLSKRLDETEKRYQEDVYDRLEDVVDLVEDRLKNPPADGAEESGDFKTEIMKAFFTGAREGRASNGKAS